MNKQIVQTKINGTIYIAFRDLYEREAYIYKTIQANAHRIGVEHYKLDRPEPDVYSQLNDDQQYAYRIVMGRYIAALTGPAGTGKTFLIDAICQGYEMIDKTIALCAPTGKAARRMHEATGRPARTIHRLLEHDGTGFQRDGFNLLSEYDVIIVDESSMVGVPLFYSLLIAIDLSRTKLLLVGDHNQLLPVEPGAPFRDLIGGVAAGKVKNDTRS